jgi:hypothetical protein
MRKADRKSKRRPEAAGGDRPRAGHAETGRRRRLAVLAAWGIGGALLVALALAAMPALRDRILRKQYAGPKGRARVRLTRTPRWMPEALAREIVADVTPPNANLADSHLAENVYRRAVANPWVRRVCQVRVRPNAEAPGGIVETSLDFRRPAARIRNHTRYLYVDAEGYRLPASQVPQWVVTFHDRRGKMVRQVSYLTRTAVPAAWRPHARRIHYVTIDGVTTGPPPPGWQWTGDDLAAGLRLVRLVNARSYRAQITLIDVRNHAGRITRNEPELRLYAQIGRGRPTDIRFGRFPAPCGGDYIISPQRKLSYLDEYVAAHGGRLAGVNSYLDLRFDQLHVSIN